MGSKQSKSTGLEQQTQDNSLQSLQERVNEGVQSLQASHQTLEHVVQSQNELSLKVKAIDMQNVQLKEDILHEVSLIRQEQETLIKSRLRDSEMEEELSEQVEKRGQEQEKQIEKHFSVLSSQLGQTEERVQNISGEYKNMQDNITSRIEKASCEAVAHALREQNIISTPLVLRVQQMEESLSTQLVRLSSLETQLKDHSNKQGVENHILKESLHDIENKLQNISERITITENRDEISSQMVVQSLKKDILELQVNILRLEKIIQQTVQNSIELEKTETIKGVSVDQTKKPQLNLSKIVGSNVIKSELLSKQETITKVQLKTNENEIQKNIVISSSSDSESDSEDDESSSDNLPKKNKIILKSQIHDQINNKPQETPLTLVNKKIQETVADHKKQLETVPTLAKKPQETVQTPFNNNQVNKTSTGENIPKLLNLKNLTNQIINCQQLNNTSNSNVQGKKNSVTGQNSTELNQNQKGNNLVKNVTSEHQQTKQIINLENQGLSKKQRKLLKKQKSE